MPSVTDNLSSLVGGTAPLAASALVESGGGAQAAGTAEAEGGAAGAGGGAAVGSFADVLGRMQRLKNAEGQDGAQGVQPEDGAGQGSGMGVGADNLSDPSSGSSVGSAGRQEVAASFAIQWALLARGGQAPGASGSESESADPAGSADSEGGETTGRPQRVVEAVDPGLVSGFAGLPGPPGPPALTGLPGRASGSTAADPSGKVPSTTSSLALGDPTASGVPPVVALPISPALSVLTMAGTADLQGEAALMEFARSQGFDPGALRLVFGGGADPARSSAGSGSLELGLESGGTNAAALPIGPSGVAGWVAGSAPALARVEHLVASGQSDTAPGEIGTLRSTATATEGTPTRAAGLSAGMAAGLSAGMAAGLSTAAVTSPQATGSAAVQPSASSSGLLAGQVGSQPPGPGGTGGSGGRRGTAAAAERSGFTVERMTSAAGAGAASAVVSSSGREASAWVSGAQWAQAVGRLSSVADVAAAGAPEAAAPPLPAVGAAGSVAEAGSALPATGTSSASTPSVHQTTQTAARPELGPLDLRAHLDEQAEGLSRRMGEALAQRVMAQIDSGQWQIRLSVMPEQLGPIDIDLQVTGQRVEAQFQVANAQTQSLIQDSVPRLKDIVGSSGMDLASVWVSGGWSERNRGNPTPGQPDESSSATAPGGANDDETAAVPGVDAVERSRSTWTPGQGALDILI